MLKMVGMVTILLLVFNNGLIIQWLESNNSTIFTNTTEGNITWPITFPTRVLCHVATCFLSADIISIRNTTNTGAYYQIYDRDSSSKCCAMFDVLVVGY